MAKGKGAGKTAGEREDLSESPEIKRLRRKLGVELLWVYILSLLKKKKSHAYILRKMIEEKFGFLTGNVSVYVVLYKLEARGFVKADYDENKKVYSITSKGKDLLKIAKKEMKEINEMIV